MRWIKLESYVANQLQPSQARAKLAALSGGGRPGGLGPAAAAVRKPYMHESRHAHATRRKRGPGGRFLTKEELAAARELETQAQSEGAVAQAPVDGGPSDSAASAAAAAAGTASAAAAAGKHDAGAPGPLGGPPAPPTL